MPGGVGDVNTSMHIPALVHLITRISKFFDVTIYSVIKPDNNCEYFYCDQKRNIKSPDLRYKIMGTQMEP